MRHYVVLIEQGRTGSFGASVPDLPGCVAAADTLDELRVLIQEAVAFHIEGLQQAGLPVPPPRTQALTLATA